MGKTIIPIGRTMGPSFAGDGSFEQFEICLGDDVKELTADEVMVWACAFDNNAAHFNLNFDRATYNAAIESRNETMFDDDRDRLIGRLFELGLLEEVDLGSGVNEEFLRKYRLIPTGHGLGNSQTDPTRFGIGRLNEPELFVGSIGYLLWLFGYRMGSMWAACEAMAKLDDEISVNEAATGISTYLPAILAVDCGYLEPI